MRKIIGNILFHLRASFMGMFDAAEYGHSEDAGTFNLMMVVLLGAGLFLYIATFGFPWIFLGVFSVLYSGYLLLIWPLFLKAEKLDTILLIGLPVSFVMFI